MTKPRSDAKLLNLPAAQQSTLTQWLLDGLAYHIIQQRLLAEFQIECSAMAVSRYWHKVVQPLLAHQRAHLLDRAKFIEKSNEQQPHAVDLLVTDLLEQRLLELLSDPANLPDDLKSSSNSSAASAAKSSARKPSPSKPKSNAKKRRRRPKPPSRPSPLTTTNLSPPSNARRSSAR
jgi:hypothetical protein